jgi:hypothetical protein
MLPFIPHPERSDEGFLGILTLPYSRMRFLPFFDLASSAVYVEDRGKMFRDRRILRIDKMLCSMQLSNPSQLPKYGDDVRHL